jgi:amidase
MPHDSRPSSDSESQTLTLGRAVDLTRALRQRSVSAVELLQIHLDRVDRLNPQVNAVIAERRDAALQRAREADAALARGERWGPLHGLPMTVKESFDVQGLATTWGFERQRGHVAEGTADAVRQLEDAGAVVFGKTNVPVALADWQSFNPVYGTTNNPWDLGRTPGGSSGGSAAALACGMTALEIGSDIGSSIRNPAHYCGVYGHKPTWGVVPLAGQQLPGEICPDATDIGVAGPLARSAHDLTLAMEVLAGRPTLFTPLGRVPVAWRDDGRPARQLRVAVMADVERAPVSASTRQALQALTDFLVREGVTVSTEAVPIDPEAAWQLYIPLVRSALAGHLSDDEYAHALAQASAAGGAATEMPRAHWRGQSLSHREWLQLDEHRHGLRRQWEAFFADWDLLIQPVAATPAFPHIHTGMRWERMLDVDGTPQPHTTQMFWAGYSGLFGLPSTAVPIGQSPEGLPIGAQIIGPALADPVCLRFARWLEEAWRGFVAPPLAR